MASTATTPRPKIYTNLELLRFFAAFVVVTFHYVHFAWPAMRTWQATASSEGPAGWLLGPIYDHGDLAVQFFWTLSGFIFFSQYAQRIQAREVSGSMFAKLRFSRLWPLYVSTALFVYLLQPVYQHFAGHPAHFAEKTNPTFDLLLSFFMANHWDPRRTFSLNGPAWSISVEVLVYLLFFILARYLPTRLFWPATFILALLLPFATDHHVMIEECITYFFLGGVTYLAVQKYKLKPGLGRMSINVAASTLAVAGIAGLIWAPELFLGEIGIAFAAIIFVAAGVLPDLKGRKGYIATHLGNTTYSSYLIHYPLQLAIMTIAAAIGFTLPMQSLWFLITYLIATYALAFLVYNKFELPAQRWLRKRFRVSGTRASNI